MSLLTLFRRYSLSEALPMTSYEAPVPLVVLDQHRSLTYARIQRHTLGGVTHDLNKGEQVRALMQGRDCVIVDIKTLLFSSIEKVMLYAIALIMASPYCLADPVTYLLLARKLVRPNQVGYDGHIISVKYLNSGQLEVSAVDHTNP